MRTLACSSAVFISLAQAAMALERDVLVRKDFHHRQQLIQQRNHHGFRRLDTKRLFAKGLLARSQQQRHLSESNNHLKRCDYDRLLQKKCTVEEFCELVAEDPFADVQCRKGDFASDWQIVSLHKESCFYIDEDEEYPYDESRFNPETDFCYTWTSTLSMHYLDAIQNELMVEYSRPVKGSYREVFDLHTCDNPNPELDFVTGYCDTCSVVEIEGVECNYCGKCPDGSTSTYFVDCSNLHTSIMSTCHPKNDDQDDVDNDEIFWLVNGYLGADCTFNAVTENRCTLDTFCNQYGAFQGEAAVCSGTVKGEWELKQQQQETCYYHSSKVKNDHSLRGLPFDEALFDESMDFCLSSTTTLHFEQTKLVDEERVYHITHPLQMQQVLTKVTEMEPCNHHGDYHFGEKYCAKGCSSVFLGEQECENQCTPCPSGHQAIDCSNVHATLVESCDPEAEHEFYGEVVTFFQVQQE